MPKPVSRKQQRMMHAIMANGPINDRQPPKSVASKYSGGGKDLPESKDNNRGGKWNAHGGGSKDEKESKKDKEKDKKKKKKKDVKKSAFDSYYGGRGVGVIVLDKNGRILVGKDTDSGLLTTPGGHVDPGETFEEAAKRELKEEAGIDANNLHELGHFKEALNDTKTYLVTDYSGRPRPADGELTKLKFVEAHLLADEVKMRQCAKRSIMAYLQSHFKKSTNLKHMLAFENLEKNILRGPDGRDVVYDVSHGEALKLVGNGCFRFLERNVKDMGSEDFKDIKIDTHTLHIRKHANDQYSGRITDGHKLIHQFTNKSLPQLCADVMSVFEWYSPEDEGIFDVVDSENLSDDAIHGGLKNLSDNYKRHSLANIYEEMETIRGDLRNGAAVDLQQIESRMMKLFDKLEERHHEICDKHNSLSQQADSEISKLEAKLKDLQCKIDALAKKPSKVEAYSTNPANASQVHEDGYPYLSKPAVVIDPSGKISITFGHEWTGMEKSNFLKDIRAKVIKKSKKK